MDENLNPIILIVDDNPQNLHILTELVEAIGCEPVIIPNGKDALQFIKIKMPDLILLDVIISETDGYTICKSIKSYEEFRDIPIIFLTTKSDTQDVISGFNAGGIDYLTKPFNSLELKVRLKTHITIKKSQDKIKNSILQLMKINEELKESNEISDLKNLQLTELVRNLDMASKIDILTGIFNRRYMNEKFKDEITKFRRNKKYFSIIIADIDYFKKVNDTHGHDCGDEVLKQVAKHLSKSVRATDFLCRWGGEEFLILLPEIELEGASILAERIRKKIENHRFVYNNIQFSVTLTLGISSFNGNESVDELIKKADLALYDGKNKGRNCVMTR